MLCIFFIILVLVYSSKLFKLVTCLVCFARADESFERLGTGCVKGNCYHRGFSEKNKNFHHTIVSTSFGISLMVLCQCLFRIDFEKKTLKVCGMF